MSSFRNLRFGFQQKLLPLYGIWILAPGAAILVIVALGSACALALGLVPERIIAWLVAAGTLLFYPVLPWVKKMMMNYSMNGHRYGASKFSAKYLTGRTYRIYMLGISIGILAIYALLAQLAFLFVLIIFVTGDIIEMPFDVGITSDDFISAIQHYFRNIELIDVLVIVAIPFFIALIGYANFRASMRGYFYGAANLAEKITFQSSVRTWPLYWIFLTNLLVLIATLGLAYPWVSVRLAKYYAKNTMVFSKISLDDFVAGEEETLSALGEEVGEAFDMDMDIAI